MQSHRAFLVELVAQCPGEAHRQHPGRVEAVIDANIYGPLVLGALKLLMFSRRIHTITSPSFDPFGRSDDDGKVANLVLGAFCTAQRVVVLTADRGKKLDGLRSILHRDVKPTLRASQGHGLSLLILHKRSKTSVFEFARRIPRLLWKYPYAPGFDEVKV